MLRAIDKLDRLGPQGVRALLGEGRKDESGDYTKGAGLTNADIDRVIAFTAAKGADATATLTNLRGVVGSSAHGNEGTEELAGIAALVDASGYNDGRVVIDPSVVRGLEYYTGPVYEVELTFAGGDGTTRFGSVGGGGRYDGLVSRFRSEPVPATGFSIGVSRLAAALAHLGKLDSKAEPGPVVVTVFDKDRIADYQRMVALLRAQKIRAELYLGSGKFGPQMKYADKRNAPCVVIQGSDEGQGRVDREGPDRRRRVRQAREGPDQYLQKQAQAQITVAEDKLLDAVREVLARHKISWS